MAESEKVQQIKTLTLILSSKIRKFCLTIVKKRLVPTPLGIWDQKEVPLWENEVDNFRATARGNSLLTLGNTLKYFGDETREDYSTTKPSKGLNK